MTRVSPHLLRAIAAANAIASPLPAHHRLALEALSRGGKGVSDQERWFLDAIRKLPALSERQWERLRRVQGDIELRHGR